MTETSINGVVIETSQPITIRNGVVECGTDPEYGKGLQRLLMQRMMDNSQYRNMTADELALCNQRTRGYNCFGNLY